MADRQVTLAVPNAIDAAYLLIVGQIVLLYSKILYFLASAFFSTALPKLNAEQLFFLVFTIVVPLVLVINVMSCWASTRATFEEFQEYPNSLFLIDVWIIIVMFMINNFVSLSVVPADAKDSLYNLLSIGTTSSSQAKQAPTQLEQARLVATVFPPLLYFSSALLTALYLGWNVTHAKERMRLHNLKSAESMGVHNAFLLFACVLQFALTGTVLVWGGVLAVAWSSFVSWVVIWCWLNGWWIFKSPLAPGSRERQSQKEDRGEAARSSKSGKH